MMAILGKQKILLNFYLAFTCDLYMAVNITADVANSYRRG